MKKKGGCDFCRTGWIWDYPSYYSIYSIFATSSIDGDNLGRYTNKEFDKKAKAGLPRRPTRTPGTSSGRRPRRSCSTTWAPSP